MERNAGCGDVRSPGGGLAMVARFMKTLPLKAGQVDR
jgi:hypothetical protein